jgi:Mrp family chromosome partitioning ATPase
MSRLDAGAQPTLGNSPSVALDDEFGADLAKGPSASGAADSGGETGELEIARMPSARRLSRRDEADLHAVREQARKLSLALFFREQSPVRSLGFTSAVGGEGKSYMALMTAAVLAHDSTEPVILVEANWEHPTLHAQLGLPPTPGLAEWLRQECDEAEACHQVAENLGVIVAGNGRDDAVKLLRVLRERSAVDRISATRALYIFDLPPIVTCSYGHLAASVAESVILVVRAGVTPEGMVAEACAQLKDLPVEGVMLNQVSSHIPKWLQHIL